MPSPDDKLRGTSEDDEILQEAKDRFRRWQEYEGDFLKRYTEDVKFAWADSDNKWQWPNDMAGQSQANDKPRLTINKTGTVVRDFTNSARKNKPSISVKPVGEQVSFKAAQIWEGLIRSIERKSSAQTVYDSATESMGEGGIGYWRVTTEFVDDDSFDQEIRIAPVYDHTGVALDCDIKQKDGCDAKWGFVFDEMPRKEAEKALGRKFPASTGLGIDNKDDWAQKDTIRVAEYYRIVIRKDKLIFIEDAQGESATFKQSEIPAKWKALIDNFDEENPQGRMRTRPIKVNQLEWYKIAGSEIIDRRKLKGKYIPIVRCVGRERKIEGKLERKGIVRPLKDPQRMYNYNSSAQVETAAMQTKTPWTVAIEAIEGYQKYWDQSNTANYPYLLWRAYNSDGKQLPKPERVDAPRSAEACIKGMEIANAEFEMASGQYLANRAQPMVERTPQAIDARTGQGETATYDLIDNVSVALRHTGNIIIDLGPHIYDTKRIEKILARDGTLHEVTIDPQASEAHQESKDGEDIRVLFNPKIGRYAVEADVGPAYATQRQEAWNAFINIVTKSPELTAKIADLGFTAADFPMADKIAERIRRDIKANAPWLLDDEEVGPFVKNLQATVAQLQQDNANKDKSIADALQKVAEYQLRLRGKEEKRVVDDYRAETERIVGLGNTVKDMRYDVLKPIIRQTLAEMMGFTLTHVEHAQQQAIDDQLHQADVAMPGATNGIGSESSQ